jgi:hypothetical protein
LLSSWCSVTAQLAHCGETLGADQLLLRVGQRRAERAIPPHPLEDPRQQLGKGVVLGEVILRAQAERCGRERLAAVTGHHHHRRGIGPGEQLGEEIHPPDVG